MYYSNNNQNNQNQVFNKNSYLEANNQMAMVNPTYDQFIIKPPDRNKTHGRISQKLIVDSRDRDIINYPNPNNYKYKIKDEYKDVISVELVLADIPNTVYNIYEKNNEMILSIVGEDCKKFKIPHGEYSNESFLNVLNGSKGNIFQIFASNNDTYFNFYEDPDTNLIKIQSNKQFTFNLNYNTDDKLLKCNQGDINKYYESINYNSIDFTLGFDRKQYTGESKYNNEYGLNCDNNLPTNIEIDSVSTSSSFISEDGYTLYQIKIQNINKYDCRKFYSVGDYLTIENNLYRIDEIVNKTTMNIKDFLNHSISPVSGDNISVYYAIYATRAFELGCSKYVILKIPQFHMLKADPTSIDDSYAIIPLEGNKCKTIINSGSSPLDKDIKYFNPPLDRLQTLDIKFLRYDGSLVNFKGVDHMLAFRITCLNQPGKYNNFTENLF